MSLRDYSGVAQPTVLSGAITAASTTINVVDGTGYPLGATGPFVITIDAGTTSEEKVLVATRTGNTFSVATSGRGWDGTTAADHSNAASVAHTYSATDAREANAHVNDATGDPHPQYLTPAEGVVLYAASGHTHPAVADPVKTVRISHTFTLSSDVLVAVGDAAYIPPFFIAAPPSQTVKLVKARHRINSGTSATVKLQRNGVDLAGWTGLSVTTTSTTSDPADVTFSDEDTLALVVTAVSGTPKNLTFTVNLDYVV